MLRLGICGCGGFVKNGVLLALPDVGNAEDVENDKEPPVSGKYGLDIQAVIDAIFESDRTQNLECS